MLTFTVGPQEAARCDLVLARRFPETSRRHLAQLFRAGQITLDGVRAKKGDFAKEGSVMTVAQPPLSRADLSPFPEGDVQLELLHEDNELICVQKRAGMPSQPLRADERGTVANALVARFPECAVVGDDPREAGLVHRLDIGTSGVLVAARNAALWTALRNAFTHKLVRKKYLALVQGNLPDGATELRLQHKGRRMIALAVDSPDGQSASTEWKRVTGNEKYTLIECIAHTGRMHQIRAHLAAQDCPILGDDLYGADPVQGTPLLHHFLHGSEISFPGMGEREALTISAPLPADRREALTALGLAV